MSRNKNVELKGVRFLCDNDIFKTKVFNGYIETKMSLFPNMDAMEKE